MLTEQMVVLLSNGISIELEIAHSNLLSEIYYHNVYDIHHIYEPGEIVIDVGAHVGVFTLKAAQRKAIVHAIEPHPDNFKMLVQNVTRNQLKNVICHECGLGEDEGQFKLWLHPNLSGSHSLRFKREKWIAIKLMTLDSFMKEEDIDEVSLLKMDVEGAEPEVLRGAKDSMKNVKEVVVAAYHFSEEASIVEAILEVFGFATQTEVAGPYIDTKFVYGRRK